MEYNFFKADEGVTSTFGVPYAYDSVMHYSAYAFSPNGEDTTIVPLVSFHFLSNISMEIFKFRFDCRKKEQIAWAKETGLQKLTFRSSILCTIVKSDEEDFFVTFLHELFILIIKILFKCFVSLFIHILMYQRLLGLLYF